MFWKVCTLFKTHIATLRSIDGTLPTEEIARVETYRAEITGLIANLEENIRNLDNMGRRHVEAIYRDLPGIRRLLLTGQVDELVVSGVRLLFLKNNNIQFDINIVTRCSSYALNFDMNKIF